MPSAIICDTTVWLYLGLAQQEQLLFELYDEVYTTHTVCHELDAGRLNRSGVIDPRLLPWVRIVRAQPADIVSLPDNDLDQGELSIIAYALQHDIDVAGLDDRAARQYAKTVGLIVVGTPGILIGAKRFGFLDRVRPVLDQMIRDGFYLSKNMREHVLTLVGETET